MEQGSARQLGCSWKTVWMAVRPVLEVDAADESRFVGVTCLGVDEHVWHHVSNRPVDQGGRGPKEFTGMVDLTRHQDGHLRARLLDQVRPAGEAYKTWLRDRGDAFRKGVQVATLEPFHGYKNAIDDQLEDAVAVLGRQQRRDGGHHRPDRTRPLRRAMLPRPRQLPPQNAHHRRRPTTMTPRSSQKTRVSRAQHDPRQRPPNCWSWRPRLERGIGHFGEPG